MTRYRVIMYERSTDRVGGMIDVPPPLAPQVLLIVDIKDVDEPGETELSDDQARKLATLMSFQANIARYIYHLETLADRRLLA